jgi:hypothetical protein
MQLAMKIFTGIGLLIAIYLILSRGKDTNTIIESSSKGLVDTIATLQGR